MFRRPSRTQGDMLSSALKSDRALRVRSRGSDIGHPRDAYHFLLRLSLPKLALLLAGGFIAFNLLFAVLYWFQPGGVVIESGPPVGHFWEMFFFSVHTVATIGYGNMVPVTSYTNLLVVLEITFGILFFALTTGIAFARFSRPTARILFSRVAVVQDVEGLPTLMFRAANQRHNLIFEAQVSASLLADEQVGGAAMRRFHDLKLVRDANPVFALTWTVMHPIDADSPLRPWLDARVPTGDAEIVVILSGTDNHSGQTIHGRWAYGADDIHWDERFVDILSRGGDGERVIDYTHFHETEPISAL